MKQGFFFFPYNFTQVNDVPFVENPVPGIELEQHLPVTDLLEHWKLEVRQRNTGRLDKVNQNKKSSSSLLIINFLIPLIN